jgi:uncharacterized membrane protein (DUF485 family)
MLVPLTNHIFSILVTLVILVTSLLYVLLLLHVTDWLQLPMADPRIGRIAANQKLASVAVNKWQR